MICTKWIAEIVESARRGGKPDAALEAHLAMCGECHDRWKAESELTSHFRVMRIHALARRPDDAGPAIERSPMGQRGEMLLREFDRRHARTSWVSSGLPSWLPSWQWGLAAAAALLLAIGAGRELGLRNRPAVVRPAGVNPAVSHGTHQADVVLYEASMDAGTVSSDEFIAVPYSAPLATGEIVRVVRTDLYPEALASMGIDVNPAWSGDMAADVVVGQDGFPRAVRLAENSQF